LIIGFIFCNRQISYLNRKFELPEDGPVKYVKYSTGQPIGTYSSWPVFTLTHHGWHSHQNDVIARTYVRVMTSMGVEISVNITHVSKDTYEFAKR